MAGARRPLGRPLLLMILGASFFMAFALAVGRPARQSSSAEVLSDTQPSEALIRELESRDRMTTGAGMGERIVHVAMGQDGYQKPIPATVGGYDAEVDLSRAAQTLVRRILSHSLDLSRRSPSFNQAIQVRAAGKDSQADLELAQLVAALLRGEGLPATHSATGSMPSLWIEVNDQELSDFGRVITARESYGGAWSVIVDPEMRMAESYQRLRANELRLSFKSDRQTNALFARDDAFDILQRRLREKAWLLAQDRYGLELEDEEQFDSILQQRFPGLTLADLGRKEFTLVRKVLEDDAETMESFQVDVSWVGDRHMLQAVGETTLGVMKAEAREPYVRYGLGFGALILCLLGWLKVDWWLHGRHSFLTKVAFAILGLLGFLFSMNMPFHV